MSRLLQRWRRQMPPFPALLPTHSGNQGMSCLHRNNYAQKKQQRCDIISCASQQIAASKKVLFSVCMLTVCTHRHTAGVASLLRPHRDLVYSPPYSECLLPVSSDSTVILCTHRHTASACCQSPPTPPCSYVLTAIQRVLAAGLLRPDRDLGLDLPGHVFNRVDGQQRLLHGWR